ncbi:hypothetical protein BV22DRAFT_654647 [Leucogyrophana mollusca]|uniref:Uncharacterized protein n=1 Tax=Leucogyrophana mollusca TaxID=85980 RepID=A0ACB8B9K0_9AGAM|nr:hypothetical protein BV22DRAFT_654647 [Leucogyrophana mollusca]
MYSKANFAPPCLQGPCRVTQHRGHDLQWDVDQIISADPPIRAYPLLCMRRPRRPHRPLPAVQKTPGSYPIADTGHPTTTRPISCVVKRSLDEYNSRVESRFVFSRRVVALLLFLCLPFTLSASQQFFARATRCSPPECCGKYSRLFYLIPDIHV